MMRDAQRCGDGATAKQQGRCSERAPAPSAAGLPGRPSAARRAPDEAAEHDEHIVHVQRAVDLPRLLLRRRHREANGRDVRVVPRVIVDNDGPVGHRRRLVAIVPPAHMRARGARKTLRAPAWSATPRTRGTQAAQDAGMQASLENSGSLSGGRHRSSLSLQNAPADCPSSTHVQRSDPAQRCDPVQRCNPVQGCDPGNHSRGPMVRAWAPRPERRSGTRGTARAGAAAGERAAVGQAP